MSRPTSTAKKLPPDHSYPHLTPSRPSSLIQYKLQSIKKQIQRQHHNHKLSITSRQKQNPNPNLNPNSQKKSILETKKLKKAIQQSQQSRFKEKYNRLYSQYTQEKKEFLDTIERFNLLKSSIESYFRSPFNIHNVQRLKQFYLSQAVGTYTDKVTSIMKENQELKKHVEKLLEMFQINDFEDMINELTSMNQEKNKEINWQRSREKQSEKQEQEIERLKRDLIDRGKDIEKILSKLNSYQNKIDEMHEESQRTSQTIQQLQRLNDKLEQARGLVQEQLQDISQQREQLLKDNIKLKKQNQNLKRIIDKLGENVADLEQERELLKVNVDDQIEDGERIHSLVSQNQCLMSQISAIKKEFEGVKQEVERQSVKIQQMEFSETALANLEKRLNCERGEIFSRVNILLASQQQLQISSGLLSEFTKNIEALISQVNDYKAALSQITLQKDQYKFLLSNLNREIELIREHQKFKADEIIQIGQSNFKKSTKDLTLRQEILMKETEQYRHETAFYKKESESLLSRNEKLSGDLMALQLDTKEIRIQNSKMRLEIDVVKKNLAELTLDKDRVITSLTNTSKKSIKQFQTLKQQFQQSTLQTDKLRLQNLTLRNDLQRQNQILKQQLRVSTSNVLLRDQQLFFKTKQHQIQLEIQRQNIKQLEKTITESSTLLSKLNIQIEEFRVNNMKGEQEKSKLHREIDKGKKELQQERENATAIKKAGETMRQEVEKQEGVMNGWMKELKEKEKEKEGLREKAKEYERKAGEGKGELEEVMRAKDKLRADFERIVKDYEMFKKEGSKIKAQRNQLISANEQLLKTIQSLKSSPSLNPTPISDLQQELSSLRFSNVHKDNLLLELQDLNASLTHKSNQLSSLLIEKNAHIKELNLQLTSFKQQIQHLLEQQKQNKKEINGLIDEIAEARKYVEGETERIKEVVRALGQDREIEEVSRFEEIKEVYRGIRNNESKEGLAGFKKSLLELSVVEGGPRLKYQEPLSPCSSISKEFNFRHNNDNDNENQHQHQNQVELQQLKSQNEQLNTELRALQKKIIRLQNDQNTATLKVIVGKFFEALLTEENKKEKEAELLESIRIILRILEFGNSAREDILNRVVTLRKKKTGFFSFLK